MSGFTNRNYPQLLAYRNEGLRKVGARFPDEIERPKARSFFPTVWPASRESSYPSMALGPWRIGAVGPSMILAHEAIANVAEVKVLDIGCAAGHFRNYLQLRDANRAVVYTGMDIAPPPVDFPVYASLDSVPDRDFDLVFMSEVAEHMPADVFAEQYAARFPQLLSPSGIAVVGVPNPLAPTILQRDVTHVQHYHWFDLYAILRFFFDEVDVVRTHFIHTPRRFLTLPLQRLLCYVLEIDWCEGLTLIARSPGALQHLRGPQETL